MCRRILSEEWILQARPIHGRRKGKRGRGAYNYNKIPVFGILERKGTVLGEVVKDVTAESLLSMTIKTVRRGSIVYPTKHLCGWRITTADLGRGID